METVLTPATIPIFESGEGGAFFKAPTLGAWRYYGSMKFTDFSWTWTNVTIGPIGMKLWAENALSWKHTLLDLGRCSSCKKEGEVWAPKKKSGAGKSGVWCSCCWNDHLVEFNSDGEPDLVVLSVVPSGSQAPDLGRSVVEMCAASQ